MKTKLKGNGNSLWNDKLLQLLFDYCHVFSKDTRATMTKVTKATRISGQNQTTKDTGDAISTRVFEVRMIG
ncbi:hypothetical protein RIF29_25582 [Crotalaria pallida]|uniref:Uncharacterized protein n=1 Tax=Crotalaria pallida TaxID=3830 RepID=A0AAN9EMN3_CROPI